MMHEGSRVNNSTSGQAPSTDRGIPTPRADQVISPEFLALAQSGAAFKKSLLNSDKPSVSISEAKLKEFLRFLQNQISAASSFLDALNPASLPTPGRDGNISASLLPLVVGALQERDHGSREEMLIECYLRTHKDVTGNAALLYPNWLEGLAEHLTVVPMNAELPNSKTWMQHSQNPAVHRIINPIKIALTEQTARLEKLEAGQYSDPELIDSTKAEIQDLNARLDQALFDTLYDVRPEDVPSCMQALGLSAAPSAGMIDSTIRLIRQIEVLLVNAFGRGAASPGEAIMPCLAPFGRTVDVHIPLSSDFSEVLRKDPSLLAQTLGTYIECRRFAASLAGSQDPSLEPFRSNLFESVRMPFASFGCEGAQALSHLFHPASREVAEQLMTLLESPIATGCKDPPFQPFVEDATSASPLLWLTQACLKGEELLSDRAIDVAASSPAFHLGLRPFLIRARELTRIPDIIALARLMTDQIEKATAGRNWPDWIPPILVLSILTRDPDLAKQLKNQIPAVESIQELATRIDVDNAFFRNEVERLSQTCLSSFSASMSDFYKDPGMEELWEFVERFRVFLESPDCLKGLPGNEGMKAGILISGEPGVGKSFFVKCLATELNLRLFTISPDEGEVSSQKRMIDASRKIIDEAKAYVQKNDAGCIVFIDEAESVVAARDDASTSPEQAELTCYLLQEINVIRREYPRILLIAATNFPDRIDAAMVRPGRLDIRIDMKKPDSSLRGHIIRDTLKKEGLDLDIDEQQMTKLLEVTEEFIPLQITRSIFETSRVDRLVAQKRGLDFELNFDTILAKLQNEARVNRPGG